MGSVLLGRRLDYGLVGRVILQGRRARPGRRDVGVQGIGEFTGGHQTGKHSTTGQTMCRSVGYATQAHINNSDATTRHRPPLFIPAMDFESMMNQAQTMQGTQGPRGDIGMPDKCVLPPLFTSNLIDNLSGEVIHISSLALLKVKNNSDHCFLPLIHCRCSNTDVRASRWRLWV